MAKELPVSFTHSPAVAFRAARKYVHSTTLYEEIVAGAKAAGLNLDGPVELTTRRLMVTQPEFQYSLTPADVSARAPAVFAVHAQGVRWHGIVVNRDDPVVSRMPYDETLVSEFSIQRGKGIQLGRETSMRPIEVVTALNLLLHRKLFTIAEGQQWYLARMYFARPLRSEDTEKVHLELVRNLANKLTRSAVRLKGGLIGYVEFMLGDVA